MIMIKVVQVLEVINVVFVVVAGAAGSRAGAGLMLAPWCELLMLI